MSNKMRHTGHGGYHDSQKKHKQRKHSQWRDVWYRLRKNKLAMVGMIIAAILVLLAIFAPLLAPYDYSYQNITERFQYPNWQHLFGTDNLGRDTLSRVLYGGRTSLLTSVVALIISMFVAVIMGTVAGFFGGTVDIIIMRILDVIGAVPSMFLAITISAALGSGVVQTAIAIAIGSIGQMARLVRGSILQSRQQQYVESAFATGSGNIRIMFKQVLPNVLSPLIITASMGIGGKIMQSAGLSFIGLGIQEPIPEWGAMISSGRAYMRYYPHLIFIPGIFVALVVLAFNLIGDGLRDALDPKLRQ